MASRLDRLIHAILHLPWWAWMLGLMLTILLGFGLLVPVVIALISIH